MRLVGPNMHDYTMSTCYFLGQRPEVALEIVTHPCEEQASRTFVTSDGAVVTSFVLLPQSPLDDQVDLPQAGAKRTFEQMLSHDGGVATDAAHQDAPANLGEESEKTLEQGGSEEAAACRLTLCYSPYHRAKSKVNSKRRTDMAGHAARAVDSAPSLCYSVKLPSLPGKFDVRLAEALGVPNGPLRARLVKGEAVTLPNGRVVEAEECVSTRKPGGTILIIDCPTVAHAAALARRRLFWHLVKCPAEVGPLTVVHMSPQEVLACEDYAAWSQPFPASSPPHHHPPAAPSATATGSKGEHKKGDKGDKKGKHQGAAPAAAREASIASTASAPHSLNTALIEP